jgi:hypothetical protein
MKKAYVALTILVSSVLFGGAAYATPPSNAEQLTDMATGAFGEQTPIILAVGGAAVAVAVVLFGTRLVLRVVRSGGRI